MNGRGDRGVRPIYDTPDPRDPIYYDEDDGLCAECAAPLTDDGLCEDCDADEIAARAEDAAQDSRIAQDEGGVG